MEPVGPDNEMVQGLVNSASGSSMVSMTDKFEMFTIRWPENEMGEIGRCM